MIFLGSCYIHLSLDMRSISFRIYMLRCIELMFLNYKTKPQFDYFLFGGYNFS